jgi:hypothetical protein
VHQDSGPGAANAVGTLKGRPDHELVCVPAAYAAGRLGAEFLRGDPGRRRVLGLTEAQWTSLLIVAVAASVAVGTQASCALALTAAAAVVAGGTAAWLAARSRVPASDRRLLEVDHVLELARALSIARGEPEATARAPFDVDLHVATTSLGLAVSASPHHYTLSRGSPALTTRTAGRLAATVLLLGRHSRANTLVPGRRDGVFHLLTSA